MVVLLITGALDITQFDVPFTALTDVNQRVTQYLNSISFAIEHYSRITHLVFCENTNFSCDYSALKEKAQLKGKQLEIISFQGDYSSIQSKGKGYGEGEIINYAISHSEILPSCSSFYKLTGRTSVLNMDQLVQLTIQDNAFDYYQGKVYNRGKDHIETLFFKTNKDFYQKYLIEAYKEVDEKKQLYLEHVFYKKLKELKLGSFPVFPRISGQSGTTGKPYDKSKLEKYLERLYYHIGFHKIEKTVPERILTGLFILALVLWRKLKAIAYL